MNNLLISAFYVYIQYLGNCILMLVKSFFFSNSTAVVIGPIAKFRKIFWLYPKKVLNKKNNFCQKFGNLKNCNWYNSSFCPLLRPFFHFFSKKK